MLWHNDAVTSGTRALAGDQPPTLTEWADQQLRQSILQGDHRPGDTLVISTLAEQLAAAGVEANCYSLLDAVMRGQVGGGANE